MKTAALIALLCVSSGCGYRLAARATLPGDTRSVRVVALPPARVDEPALSRLLALELCRQLSRAGIRASTTGRAEAVLQAQILALVGVRTTLDHRARAIAERELALRLELVLRDARGATLWRSGLVEVQASWPLAPGNPLASEAARRRILQQLAIAAAQESVERLTAGL